MSSNFVKFKFIYSFLVLSFLFILSTAQGPGPVGPVVIGPNPVVLFPGLGGSRLEVKSEKGYSCRHQHEMNKYEPLWLNLGYMLPGSFDCFLDRIKLAYPEGGEYPEPLEGIHVRVPHFGKTESVEFLNSILRFGPGSYMHTLVHQLVKKGLVRDVSVRAAPYDFRLGLGQLDDYFQQVKDLIEETYQINGQKRVILMCHSLGCLRSVHFLNNQTESWKIKYVHEYIALSAPWGGSVDALVAELIGRDLGIFYLDIKKFRELQRTHPSIAELLPSPEVFGDEIMVKTPTQEFTASEYDKVFEYVDCKECLLNYQRVLKPNIQFPKVNTTCIHGVGISTPSRIQFLVDNPDGPFKMDKSDGDGTVNSESLSFCQRWNDVKDQYTFNYITIPGSNHDGLIKDTRTVDKILRYTF